MITPPDTDSPLLNAGLSIVAMMFAWITLKEVQLIMTIIATSVSITSGVVALYQLRKNSKKIK